MSTPSPLAAPSSSAGDVPSIRVQSDRTLVRSAARSTRYSLITVIAPTATRAATRIPANLAIVLDRSGSMAGEKFALARRAVEQALTQLQPDDRFALVVYDDSIDVLVESTLATSDAKRDALARLAASSRAGRPISRADGCEDANRWRFAWRIEPRIAHRRSIDAFF